MKAGHYLIAVVLVLAMLPPLYVLAYYCFVEPVSSGWNQPVKAKYIVGGKVAKLLFAPIHAADRSLFPDRWEPKNIIHENLEFPIPAMDE